MKENIPHPEHQNPEDAPPKMSRREIMRHALQFAVATAVATSGADKLLAAPGDTKALREYSARFKRFFRDNPRLMERISSTELVQLLRSMKSISDTSVQGTMYDFKGLPSGSLVLRSEKGHGNGIVVRFNDQQRDGMGLRKRFAVIAPKHVADLVPAPFGKKWTEHPGGYDVCACEISEYEASKHGALFLARKQAGEDISGEIGVVLGTDTDREKRFPTIIGPRTGVRNVLERSKFLDLREINPKDFHDGRIIVLPDGEAMAHTNAVTGKTELPVQGMSGSPIVYVPEGSQGVQLGGIIVQAVEIAYVVHVEKDDRIIAHTERTSLGICLDTPILWQIVNQLPESR